ncbi:MAG: hypothetical protein GKR93_02950 [Gammaproteobacteria bacterium]|nr:hypothetical protein [Gammaproteobacteria bacterium]
MRTAKFINMSSLGPGLLFAATSVGLSHLVQSTRAGAMYGLALLLVVVLANVFKYPAIKIGSTYAAATGQSLLEGYRRQGKWALLYFALTSCVVSFFAISGITLLAAGLLKTTLGLSMNTAALGSTILAITAVILIVGQYQWLERITKVLVVIISLTTVLAAILVIPDIKWSGTSLGSISELTLTELLFIAALVGLMPSPMDASVWQSLWTCAKAEAAGHSFSKEEVNKDFIIGYAGCGTLAICFLLLGAGLMHSRGIVVENSAAAFTAQFINLYTDVLGDWTKPVIVAGTFAVLYSSLLVGLDAVPRSFAVVIDRLTATESHSDLHYARSDNKWYIIAICLFVTGPLLLGSFFLDSFTHIIDFGATVAFVSAPILAYLNHRCITANEIPSDYQATKNFLRFSIVSIVVLTLFALCYLYIRFVI